MIKGIYLGKEYIYEGDIQSLGEYPSRIKGDKVWMGKTDHGFIYVNYNEKNSDEVSMLETKCADDMLRFAARDEDFKSIIKYFQKNIPIPSSWLGEIAFRAQQLEKDDRKVKYYSDELKNIILNL